MMTSNGNNIKNRQLTSIQPSNLDFFSSHRYYVRVSLSRLPCTSHKRSQRETDMATTSKIGNKKRAAARLSSSFLLLGLLLLASPRIENPRCRSNPSVFLLGVAVHAFAPQSTVHPPSSHGRAADGGFAAGPTSRHPQRHRLQMARLGKIAEYSPSDGNSNTNGQDWTGPGSSSSITTADASTTEREIRRLRTDIAKTDARLAKLRKESAKMDAARAAASSASSTSVSSSRDTSSSPIGTAFRTVLAPLAALGAGTAYLRQRAEVRQEREEMARIARAEADLAAQMEALVARREELERAERFTGVSME